MSYIDKKIQEIVKQIIAREFEDATRLKQVKDAKPEVSIASYALSKIKFFPKDTLHYSQICVISKSVYNYLMNLDAYSRRPRD